MELDPYRHAKQIADRLHQPGASLIVVLGAEAWCQRCREARHHFARQSRELAQASFTSLWLDLEDHAEFLGGFVPEDLPWVLAYRDGRLRASFAWNAGTELDRLEAGTDMGSQPGPDIWSALRAADWAS